MRGFISRKYTVIFSFRKSSTKHYMKTENQTGEKGSNLGLWISFNRLMINCVCASVHMFVCVHVEVREQPLGAAPQVLLLAWNSPSRVAQ